MHVNWQMHKFGLAIHLRNFKGDVQIQGNQVKNVLYNFNDFCDLAAEAESATFSSKYSTAWLSKDHFAKAKPADPTSALVPRQNDTLQLGSIIVIDNLHPSKSIRIVNNSFTENLLTNGLISISQKTKVGGSSTAQGQVVVSGNTFARSASYLGTNLVVITKQEATRVSQAIGSSSSCGQGVEVSYNHFASVVGSCMVDTGLVRIQCNYTSDAESSELSFINIARQIAVSPVSNTSLTPVATSSSLARLVGNTIQTVS